MMEVHDCGDIWRDCGGRCYWIHEMQFGKGIKIHMGYLEDDIEGGVE